MRNLTGTDLRNHCGQLILADDVLAIDAEDDIERLDAGLVGRAARLDRSDGGAVWTIEPEVFGGRRGDLLDRHADTTTHHVTRLNELVGDVARDVDRDRERYALIGSRLAVDLGI